MPAGRLKSHMNSVSRKMPARLKQRQRRPWQQLASWRRKGSNQRNHAVSARGKVGLPGPSSLRPTLSAQRPACSPIGLGQPRHHADGLDMRSRGFPPCTAGREGTGFDKHVPSSRVCLFSAVRLSSSTVVAMACDSFVPLRLVRLETVCAAAISTPRPGSLSLMTSARVLG